MKKLIVLFTATLLATSMLSAQEDRLFTLGIKVQPLLGWLNVEPDDPTIMETRGDGLKAGFSYGIAGINYFNENLGLGLELRHTFFQGGFKHWPNENVRENAVQRNISLQYIEIPLLLHMRTNEIGYMRYSAFFGPQMGIPIRSRVTMQSASSRTEGLAAGKLINPLAAYLVVGIGASYNLGANTTFVTSLSFNNGFVNVWKKKTDEYSKTDTKPAYMALSLGVMF